MSSWWAAYYGSGLALKPGEYTDFIKKYMEINNDSHTKEILLDTDCQINEIEFLKSKYIGKLPEQQATVFDDNMDKNKALYDSHFNITYIDEDCDGLYFVPFMKNGELNTGWKEPDKENIMPRSDVYVLWSEKALDGADYFKKERAYNSYEEFRQEFKDALEAYLPADFDWDGRLGTYSYACYA